MRASEAVLTGISTGLPLLAPRKCRWEGVQTHTHLCLLCGFWQHQDVTFSVSKASSYLSALFNYLREFEGPEG